MKACRLLAGCFVGVSCSSPAWPQEIPVELKGCLVSETTIIDRAGNVVIGMNVTRGNTDRVGPGPFPEKTAHDCRVLFTASPAGLEFTNRCNFVDAQGDRILSVASGTREAFEWQWIAGTGKFAGIRGSGKARIDSSYPRAAANLSGSCWSGKGTYTLKN